MKIEILVLGRPKEGFASRGVAHYLKLLTGLATVEVVPLKPAARTKNSSSERIKQQEAERILKRMAGPGQTVALDPLGKRVSSPRLVRLLGSWERTGLNRLTFVIGGPWGLDKSVLDAADHILSLSDLTFSHEMSLLMILEQIYRAFSAKAGRAYAK